MQLCLHVFRRLRRIRVPLTKRDVPALRGTRMSSGERVGPRGCDPAAGAIRVVQEGPMGSLHWVEKHGHDGCASPGRQCRQVCMDARTGDVGLASNHVAQRPRGARRKRSRQHAAGSSTPCNRHTTKRCSNKLRHPTCVLCWGWWSQATHSLLRPSTAISDSEEDNNA